MNPTRIPFRRLFYALMVAALVVLAVGYAPVSAQETVEIRWLSHIYEPWNVALQAQADAYMKANPGVKITYSTVEHKDLNVKITTSLAAGDPATIMGVYGPWMPQLLKANALAVAPDSVLKDLNDNFPTVMKDAATYDGKVYGYVQHIGIFLPIINTAIFEKAGVKPPTTYDELIALNKSIGKADGSMYGSTLAERKDGSWNVIQWSGILMAYGGTILNKDLTKATFNSDAGLKATEIYGQVVHPEIKHEDAFLTERSALFMNGPWQRGNFAASAPNLKYKAIAPLAGSAGQVAPSYVWFWVVSAKANPKQQEAAWKFLQWISAPEQYKDIYKNVGLIPITKKLPDELAKDEWVQAFNEGLKSARIYYANHPAWEQIDVAIGEELERFATKEINAKDFLAKAEARVNEILAKSK